MAYIYSVQNTGTSTYNGFNFVDANGITKVISLTPNLIYYLNSGFVTSPSVDILVNQLNKTDETYCLSGCCTGELISFKGLSISPVFSSATVGQTYYINEAISSANPNQIFSGCFEMVSFGDNQNPPIFSCNPEQYIDVTTLSFDGVLYSHCIICETTNPCPEEPQMCFTLINEFLFPTPYQCPTNSLGLVNGKPSYVLLDDDCVSSCGSFVYWNSLNTRWEQVTIPSYTVMAYNNNPGPVPISDQTYQWVNITPPPILCRIQSSILGDCTTPPTPTLTPTPTPTQIPHITTTTTTINYRPNPLPIKRGNECDVLTIYPMGVKCLSVDPSTTTSFDGLLTLVITGGTPPYQINWENGSVSTVLSNLNVGEYPATVTDYYGDFIVRTTCVLESPITTTTTIIPVTTTTTLIGDNLCLTYIQSISIFNLSTNQYETKDTIYQEELYPSGFVNGQPQWTSIGGDYDLYWNTGITSNWTINGPFQGQFVNSNPVTPPTVGWNVIGTSIISSVVVNVGPCVPLSIIKFKASVNQPVCGDDGSITINVSSGIVPYEYSINGGITYQLSPIFLNLSPGNYLIFVKDSTGAISNSSVTLIPSTITTYNLTLTLDVNTNSFTISLDNPLPPGASISFELDQQSTFKYWKRNVDPIPTYDCVVTVNGYGQLPITSGTSTIIPALNGCPPLFTGIQEIYDRSGTFVISGNNTITGTYTDDILTPNVGFCKGNNLSMSLSIGKVTISQCDCCEILVNNPPKKIF